MIAQSGSTLEPLAIILGCLLLVGVLLRRSPLRTLIVLAAVVGIVHFRVVPLPHAIQSRVSTLEGAGNYDTATCFFHSLLAGTGAGSAAQSCGAGSVSLPSSSSGTPNLPLLSPRF